MASELVLVRHGVTEWNTRRVLQGHRDVPLSAEGHRQAELLAQVLKSQPPPDVLFSSDLLRARQTAEYLATAWKMELQLTPALRERGFGEFEGHGWDEVHAEIERLAHAAGIDERSYRPAGGESRHDVEVRLLEFMALLSKNHAGKRVWAVSHGGVIRNVLRRLGGEVCAHLSSGFHIPNTSVSSLLRTPDHWKVNYLVNIDHLAEKAAEARETQDESEAVEGETEDLSDNTRGYA